MNIIYSIFLYSFVSLNTAPLLSQSYQSVYAEEFNDACSFYQSTKKKLTKCAEYLNESTPFVYAIVAPEVSQFNVVRNEIELNTLKILYVQGGTAYANFSVGYFQMKPKFIEEMESYFRTNKPSHHLLKTKSLTEKEQRKTRLYNLDSLDAQIMYLEAFCEIMSSKIDAMNFSSKKEKLKYISTAYNSGFNKEKKILLSMFNKKFFPHFGEVKFNYSDVSCEFYFSLLHK